MLFLTMVEALLITIGLPVLVLLAIWLLTVNATLRRSH